MNSLAIPSPRGFDGVVQGVTLLDLIQMECLSMSIRAVRVEHSGRSGRSGRIFFTGGQIVHAEVDALKGEPALFELLRWSAGSFIIEDGLRPLEDTIDRDWHTLVMAAAHVSDELAAANAASPSPMSPNPSPQPPANEALSDPEVQCAVRFTEDGSMIEAVGDIPEMLEASFAYVVQLLRHIGTSLGAENLCEIHVTGEQKKALCVLADGKITAVVGSPKLNLPALAKKLS